MSAAAAAVEGNSGVRARGTHLSLRRIYILPTRQGMGFVFMLVVMWLGAVNYDNGLAHVLVFTLGALALVSKLHTYRNLAGLRVVAAPARPVFAGDMAQLALVVDEPGTRERHDIVLRHDSPGESALAELHLERGENAQAELGLHAPRRGWLNAERVVVATRYPFGLLRAWSRPVVNARCLVYPAPASDFPPLTDTADTEHDGDFGAAGEEDFAGLREYAVGDSLRRVHWKAAARSDDLKVKRFEGAAPAEVQLDFSQLVGDTESRLSQLCAMVLHADGASLRYGLRLPGKVLPAGAGEAHRRECLTLLALFDVQPAGQGAAA